MRFRVFFASLLLLVGMMTSAAITTGNYYIKSYNGKYLTENMTSHTLTCSDLLSSTTNYSQVWKVSVSGTKVTLQNVLSTLYVQGQGSFSAQYSAGTSQQQFTLGESDGVLTFEYDSWNHGGLHCDNSNKVVEWYTSEAKSKWTVEAVEVNTSDLATQRDAFSEASTSDLTAFFTSTACTEIRSMWADYSDDNLRKAMKDLPATTQDLAVKVKNNAWTKYSGWSKTERTFRIADYKAYSNHERWTSILGLSHSLGRLANPTGIYATMGEYLHVYVGSIPAGQSVSLEVAGTGQASGEVYSLHEGMNSLFISQSGNCFVFYEVDNASSGYTPIADYAPVTVNIDGGVVQGFFDLTSGDTDDDWDAMKANLLTEPTVCLKSKTHTFNIHRDRLINGLDGSSIVDMMTVWQQVAELEDHLIGREEFDAYCNNPSSVTTLDGSGNPHATNYGTYYYEGSDGNFNAAQLLQNVGGLWTIAHEQGHNRQKLIKLAGTTEMSNNMFSNAALDWQGRYTSRVYSIKTTYNRWQQGLSWLERLASDGTWECLHMYTQLYQYFHQAGFDPSFYPNLFKAFRASPMNGSSGVAVPATQDYLKFYQTCCEVSGLDLTEFFEVYGFFTLPPAQDPMSVNDVSMGEYYMVLNDYLTYYVYVNQTMIDEAKAAVKAKNLPKCNIIFIEDRVTAPLATYEGHTAGELRQLSMQDNVKSFGQVGETGQYTTFDATCSPYKYNISGNGVVVMQGTGAVGFKLYDADGTLLGVYNTYSFRLPSAAYDDKGLKSGYVIKAAAGSGSDVAATLDAGIEIAEFPKTDMWYAFCSLRGSRYVMSNGVGVGVSGMGSSSLLEEMQWRFILRDDAIDEYDIVNRADGSYLNPDAGYNTQITTIASRPSAGWKLDAAATNDMYIIYSGDTQLNQTTFNGYPVYSYGYGSNTTDDGCQYSITEVEAVNVPEPTPEPTISDTALEELEGWTLSVSATAASSLVTGQWYVMFDRGTNPGNHGYLFEDVTSHTLYNTATQPSGLATDACRYLVRLVDAGSGKYYLQTGYGNYFGQISQSTAVPTIATKTQRITVAKIDNTDGHFYLQGESGGIILDADDIRYGNAKVVGWGTSAPTSLNGNNDWAFYPVELVGTYTRTTTAGNWGTVCIPGSVAADGISGAEIYSIIGKTVNALGNPKALQLQQVTTMEAGVPYLFLAKASQLGLTYSAASVVDAPTSDNGLVGSFDAMPVAMGMYIISNNKVSLCGTGCSIEANRAYIDMNAVSSTTQNGVKSITVFRDPSTGITELDDQMSSGRCYDLAGRCIAAPAVSGRNLPHGIYIVGGRKVVK